MATETEYIPLWRAAAARECRVSVLARKGGACILRVRFHEAYCLLSARGNRRCGAVS